MKKLIERYSTTGALSLAGILLIVYIAFGVVYLNAGTQQRKLEKQIVNIEAVVSKPLPSNEKLQAKYDEINQALAPMTDSYAIAILVSIAEESGIDTDEASGKFKVPPAKFKQTKVGGDTYQLISFEEIHVQGKYDKVMAFISDLDSGETLKNMVLNQVYTKEVAVSSYTGEEGNRRTEFRNVESAVKAMMNCAPTFPVRSAWARHCHPMTWAKAMYTSMAASMAMQTWMTLSLTGVTRRRRLLSNA